VCRMLKISAEEAGALLNELKRHNKVECKKGWWYHVSFTGTGFKIPNQFMDQMMNAMAVPQALWSAPLTHDQAQIVKSGLQHSLRGVTFK